MCVCLNVGPGAGSDLMSKKVGGGLLVQNSGLSLSPEMLKVVVRYRRQKSK